MGDLRLISGTRHVELAKAMAEYLNQPLVETTIQRFSDGEIHVKVEESARGDDFYIIQPTSEDVNESLMELLIIIDALKRASAGSITAVVPYFGYARQDRKAGSREPITAKLVANLLTAAGADRLIILDLHAAQIQGFFDIPVDNLTAIPLLAKHFKDRKNCVVVAPDVGGVRRARMFGKLLNAPIAIIDKRRPEANKSEVMHIVGDVKGKDCILVDDMIDTAGTICAAAKALKEEGAAGISIAAVHGVLSGPAKERLEQSVAHEIVITNTVLHTALPKKVTVLSISEHLGEAVRRIHNNESLSVLFSEELNSPLKRLQHNE